MAEQMAAEYPNLGEMLKVVTHDADTTLGWCDDQFEFEFGLDLLLDGLERQRDAGSSTMTVDRLTPYVLTYAIRLLRTLTAYT